MAACRRSDGTPKHRNPRLRNHEEVPMGFARLNWRLLSIFVSCISAICVTSIPGKVHATPVLQNEVEPNDTTGTANALTFGSQSAATVAGTIGVAGDFD